MKYRVNIKREVVVGANLFQAMTHSLMKNKLLQLCDGISVRIAYIHSMFNRQEKQSVLENRLRY